MTTDDCQQPADNGFGFCRWCGRRVGQRWNGRLKKWRTNHRSNERRRWPDPRKVIEGGS